MRVVEQIQTKLTLRSGMAPFLIAAAFSGLMTAFAIFDAILQGWEVCSLPAILFFGLITVLILLAASTRTYTLDKDLGSLAVSEKSLWHRHAIIEEYPLHNITAVILEKGERGLYALKFKLASGGMIGFRTPFTNELHEITEIVSGFLDVPLWYSLAEDRRLLRPLTPHLRTVRCPGCGGQLPRVERKMNAVTCGHCGTVVTITWASDLPFAFAVQKRQDPNNEVIL
jgi:hypothetical protein